MSVLSSQQASNVASFGGIDPDATLWAAAVVTNSGTVSAAQLAQTSALIVALKAAGSWALMDDAWLLVSESSVQALTSLKQRRLATIGGGAPTFTADAGYAFNGSTDFINTGFIPSSHAIAMTATNARLAIYERANVASNGAAAGAVQTSGRVLRMTAKAAGGTTGVLDIQETASTYTVSDSRGLFSASRNGGTDATTVQAYRNGAALTRTIDPTTFATALSSLALFIGGQNSGGSLTGGRATTLGMVAIGGFLTPTQELADNNAWQAYMTAKGANV